MITINNSQWICWQVEERDGKATKVPKSPLYNGNASCTNPNTWGTYEQARSAVVTYNYTGIGIVLTNNLCGIDIDGNRESGAENPLAQEIISMFNGTYIEHSPSGCGYHILCYCDPMSLPIEKDSMDTPIVTDSGNYKLNGYFLKNASLELEIYPAGVTNRFFTFSGNPVCNNDIIEMSDTVNEFLNRYMKKEIVEKQEKRSTIADIIDMARNADNGKKFSALYDNGDISLYNGDHSRADLALCSMLAFWFQGDRALIEEAFGKSALCRDKWISRPDYRDATIDRACENCEALTSHMSKETDKAGNPKKAPITLDAFEAWLDFEGIELRRNIITHKISITGLDGCFDKETLGDTLGTILHDKLKTTFVCSREDVNQLITVIVGKNKFNPVEELLASAPAWDGIDRLAELYDIMRIPAEDTLSRTLIHKWMLQALAMTYNDIERPFGSDGILVLQGNQGIGKTRLCAKLGMDSSLYKTGLYVDTKDKDTIIRCTSTWIAELGEVGCTMKSDLDRLKSFITESVDNYRVPYGRADNCIARRSSFIATTNDEKYLIDATGSRRFYTVHCPAKFDLEALKDFDAVQLWKQIEQELSQYGTPSADNPRFQSCFRLNQREFDELFDRNSEHNKLIKGQAELMDIVAKADASPHRYRYKWVTVSDIKEAYDILNHIDVSSIGKALSVLGYGSREMRLPNRNYPTSCVFFPMPLPGYNDVYFPEDVFEDHTDTEEDYPYKDIA